ncbi:MAG: glycoside hydrolase family 31 protein [Spirochaetales bacterium]
MLEAVKPVRSQVVSWEQSPHQVVLRTLKGQLRLIPLTDTIVRVTYTLEESFSHEPSLGLVPVTPSAKSPPAIWHLEESPDALVLLTQQLRLEVSRETGALAYFDAKGKLLTREPARGGKSLEVFDSYRSVLDAESVVDKVVTPDGVKTVVRDAKKVFVKKLYHAKLELEWVPGEALYGLGQHPDGNLNLRGTRQYIHQANMKVAVPFVVSTRNYAVLLDTYAPLIFSDNEHGSYLYAEAVTELDFYFIHGTCLDDLIRGYRLLSGQATMLPLWAFGYMQSQERYETQQEILGIVAEHRRRGIPLDSVVLDWRSWEGEKWGQKTFDKTRFPDVPAMTDRLHRAGAHLMLSIWPNMHASSENHAEMVAAGCLLPGSELYDPFRAEARALYWKQANEGLFSQGIDAWWCDSSEPFTPEWNSPLKPEPEKNYLQFHHEARNYLAEEHTNAYALLHSRAIFEGQRGTGSPKRVVNLTRSASTGQQKYGTIVWSGDTSANWTTLRRQIAAGLSFCASGFPYWTLDIGGFFVKQGHMWFWDGDHEQGCDDPAYRELYVRWFQLGAFLPIFRAHGTDTRREIWRFGQPGEIVYDTLVKFVELRMTLMPYIYSLAAQAALEGSTMMRVLAFDFPDDPAVLDLKDQFMLGPAFLVCPVTSTAPQDGSPPTRPVYLPEGANWYDFWTERRYSGGQTLIADAPLSRMPLYVRAGSVIPMAEVAQHTGAVRQDRFTVQVYPGADGEFTLYQDAGDGHGWEKGEATRITLRWDDKAGQLHTGERQGSFPGMPERVEFRVKVVDLL